MKDTKKGMNSEEFILAFSVIGSLMVTYAISESQAGLVAAAELAKNYNWIFANFRLPVHVGLPTGWMTIWLFFGVTLECFSLGIRAFIRRRRFERQFPMH